MSPPLVALVVFCVLLPILYKLTEREAKKRGIPLTQAGMMIPLLTDVVLIVLCIVWALLYYAG